jgi:hypothetical protein
MTPTSSFGSYVSGHYFEHIRICTVRQERVKGKKNFKSTLGLFVWHRKFSRYVIRVTGYLIRVTSLGVLSKVLSYVQYGSA